MLFNFLFRDNFDHLKLIELLFEGMIIGNLVWKMIFRSSMTMIIFLIKVFFLNFFSEKNLRVPLLLVNRISLFFIFIDPRINLIVSELFVR